MRTILSIAVAIFVVANVTHADIFQWEYINPADPSQGKQQSTTLAPGGAGVNAAPGAELRDRNLIMAYLIGADVESANFLGATLTDADFTGAMVREANFDIYTYGEGTGITPAQLYSTASYQARDLTGISFHRNNLAGANFAGQNLTNAYLYRSTLTNADFTGAEVRGANFGYDDYGGTGITPAQLYTTASYQAHDLTGIRFWSNNLSDWNFAGQNLTNAIFDSATLAGADVTDAEVRGASFYGSYDANTNSYVGGITLAQLYSTASYQARDLTGIGLGGNDVSSGNFAGQNLTNADLGNATLTGADFNGAEIRGAKFYKQVNLGTGITLAQLYSTASYLAHDLRGIDLQENNLAGGNFAAQNLTDASFSGTILSDANFSGANLINAYLVATLTDADFTGAEVRGATLYRISLPQLYSTASYKAHDLSGIRLYGENLDLAGGNFVGQNLTNANLGGATLTDSDFSGANLTNLNFGSATLTDANFTDAEIRGAQFSGTGITLAQLYSTASYQAGDLTGISLFGINLSSGNLARQNLKNANFGAANLTGASFREANLANANFGTFSFGICGINMPCPLALGSYYDYDYATLTDADLTAADARGATLLLVSNATTANLIRPDGHIDGLDLAAGGLLVVRDYDGNPTPTSTFPFPPPSPISPIPITVDEHMSTGPGGTLRIVFEADAWDSTISFAPGISVELGGTLELTFADDVNLASQVGRTFDLFDWTGVTPTGAFAISSPYAWDSSSLYTTGEVTLTAIPEPATVVLLVFAATIFGLPRRRVSHVGACALSIVCAAYFLAGPNPAFGEFNVIEATIPEMQAAMESGATTSEGLVSEYLRRIALYDDAGPQLNSVLALNPHALETARALDQERLATGPRGPLHGIPILIKDNIDTFDQPTTAGALILQGSVPPDDAFLVQKLRAAGAIILGKSNLTEFGNFVSSSMPAGFSALGGQTRNPYGPGVLSPSGSSSGSAVGVAANLAAAAVGTETQGSIVSPASSNSLVGIRATVGLISRNGVVPITRTQDTSGPLTRTVTDAAIMLGAMAGIDPNDPATQASAGKTPGEYRQFLNPHGLEGKRIGIVRDPAVFAISATEVPLAEAAFDMLELGGAEVVDHLDLSSNVIELANLWGGILPKVFTHEFVPSIESYLSSLGEDAPAHTLAEIIAFNSAHSSAAIPFGQGVLQAALATGGNLNNPSYIAQRDEAIRLMGDDGIDALLESFNLDAVVFAYDWSSLAAVPGYPAIQVPAGFNEQGVPFSVGFVGKPFAEPELIEIAYAFEQATLLRRAPALFPGDYNDDGNVDAADYTVWRDNLGGGALVNRGVGVTGPVSAADYDVWKAHFGESLGPGSGAALASAAKLSPVVPEPASLAMLPLTMLLVSARRIRFGQC